MWLTVLCTILGRRFGVAAAIKKVILGKVVIVLVDAGGAAPTALSLGEQPIIRQHFF